MTDDGLQFGDQIPLLKIAPPSEKDEERMIIDLYEQVGCVVIKFSQPHKATQTRGIADLLILCPKLNTSWWHEVKRRRGPEYKKVKSEQTPHQAGFQFEVERVGMRYIIGPLSVAQQELIERGLIR